MNLGNAIVVGFKEIWAHKFRSLLTMLGIILGVSSLVAMSALVKGMENGMREALIAIGGLEKVRIEQQDIPTTQQHLADPRGEERIPAAGSGDDSHFIINRAQLVWRARGRRAQFLTRRSGGQTVNRVAGQSVNHFAALIRGTEHDYPAEVVRSMLLETGPDHNASERMGDKMNALLVSRQVLRQLRLQFLRRAPDALAGRAIGEVNHSISLGLELVAQPPQGKLGPTQTVDHEDAFAPG